MSNFRGGLPPEGELTRRQFAVGSTVTALGAAMGTHDHRDGRERSAANAAHEATTAHAKAAAAASPATAATSSGYLMAYNGKSDAGAITQFPGNYAIGFATSDDGGRSWRRVPGGRIFQPASTGWDSGYVHAPSLAMVGRRLFLAYDATEGAGNRPQIGLAVWETGIPVGTPDVRIKLLSFGGNKWEEQLVWFPFLYYDDHAGVLHMWYSGAETELTREAIGHATIDIWTFEVTKDETPIITPTNADGYYGLSTGPVFFDGETWHMFPSAFNQNATRLSPLHYTAGEVTGPWTYEGVIYDVRPTAQQLLQTAASPGSRELAVAEAEVFRPGDPVFVQDSLEKVNKGVSGPDNWEVNFVAGVNGTKLTLLHPTLGEYLPSRRAEVVAPDQVKVNPRAIFVSEGRYTLPITAYNAGNLTYHEITLSLSTDSLYSAPFELDRTRGVLLGETGSAGPTSNAWDKRSAENACVIPHSGAGRIRESLRRQLCKQVKGRSGGLSGSTQTKWVPLDTEGPANTALDGWLPAFPGDVIRISPRMLVSAEGKAWMYIDVVTVKYWESNLEYVHWVGGGGEGVSPRNQAGCLAWRCSPEREIAVGPSILYTVETPDISAGYVGLRPMYRMSRTERRAILSTSTGTQQDIAWCYENLGGGEP